MKYIDLYYNDLYGLQLTLFDLKKYSDSLSQNS